MMTPNAQETLLLQDLERRILHGLVCEWKSAWEDLSVPQQQEMQLPSFSLKQMSSRLGYWSSEKKEICISRALVENHPWQDVRDVLRHEMAHQFVEQVLGADLRAKPHGSEFREACRILRANPGASGLLRLESAGPQPETTQEARTIRRIQKLLALANSGNRNEAEAAMVKAHSLMSKIHADSLAGNKRRDFVSVFVGKPSLRHPRQDYRLASLLTEFYCVEGIWVPAYVLDKGRMGRVLEISGSRHNVEVASYVHDFLANVINVRWKAYSRQKGLGHHRKADLAVGVLKGFRTKLLEGQKRVARKTDRKALVRVEDPQLKAYMAERYPRTRMIKRAAAHRDEGVIGDGIRIGRQVVLHKAVEERKEEDTRLIGYQPQSTLTHSEP